MAIKLNKKTSKKKIIKKIIKKNNNNIKSKQSKDLNLPKGKYFEGVGRRKVAVARVRVYPVKGDFLVNTQAVGKYFDEIIGAPAIYNHPLQLSQLQNKLTINAKVSGGGVSGQLDAVVHGLSRALIKYDPELRPVLKKAGLLTRDDRMKETRKVGMGGKARRKRQSPKR